MGGNCDVDTSFQFLRYFLDDDEKLGKIREVSYLIRLLVNNNDVVGLYEWSNVVRRSEERSNGSHSKDHWRFSRATQDDHGRDARKVHSHQEAGLRLLSVLNSYLLLILGKNQANV